jgi:hypothetical protein
MTESLKAAPPKPTSLPFPVPPVPPVDATFLSIVASRAQDVAVSTCRRLACTSNRPPSRSSCHRPCLCGQGSIAAVRGDGPPTRQTHRHLSIKSSAPLLLPITQSAGPGGKRGAHSSVLRHLDMSSAIASANNQPPLKFRNNHHQPAVPQICNLNLSRPRSIRATAAIPGKAALSLPSPNPFHPTYLR